MAGLHTIGELVGMKKTFPEQHLFAKTIGREMLLARKNKGLTQEQLAEIVDVERATIGNFENGRINPSLMTFVSISAALGVPPSRLLENAVADFERREKSTLAGVFGHEKKAARRTVALVSKPALAKKTKAKNASKKA